MAFRLQQDQPLATAWRTTVQHRLEAAAATLVDRDVPVTERVRRARTTCKKVRAALKLVRESDPKRYARENVWLRDTSRRLSAVRDGDVLLATWNRLRRESSQPLSAAAFAAVRRWLRSNRRAHRPDAAAIERRLAAVARRLEEAAARVPQWRFGTDDFALVERGFRAVYRRARRGAALVSDAPEDEPFHEWRKGAKAHAYHLRLLQCAWPEVMKAWRAEAEALASVLGDEHDLSVLRRHLLEARIGSEEADVVQVAIALIERRREEFRAEALQRGRHLFAEKPKPMARRVSAWWQATATAPHPPGAVRRRA